VAVFRRPARWLALVLTMAASPALAASRPPPGFTLSDNTDLAFTSPDRATKCGGAAMGDQAVRLHR
jgi:hypothetical protein